jgi:hypothetical protein
LVRENCAALVVSALAPKNIEAQLKALSAKGVKIVAADVPLPGFADVFVGPGTRDRLKTAVSICPFYRPARREFLGRSGLRDAHILWCTLERRVRIS